MFLCYVENSIGTWTIKIKRLLIEKRWARPLYPEITVEIDGDQKFAKNFGNTADEVISLNEVIEYGPVLKKGHQIYIYVSNRQTQEDSVVDDMKIHGDIYDFWQNGYPIKDSTRYVDVAFFWNDMP